MMKRDFDLDGTLETQVFYLQDGLGSVSALTDPSGKILERYTYTSFGVPTITGPGPDGAIGTPDDVILNVSIFHNPYLFTGREYDPEPGLHFYRFRYYDPKTGRFLQEDPIGFRGNDVNLYAYSFNNPIALKDATGLWVGIDDVLTGPVDELVILGGLAIAALLGSEFAKDSLEQLARQAQVLLASTGSQKGAGRHFQRIAETLANLTGETVGGTSPDPNKAGDPRNFKHWRTEITAFLKNIRKAKFSPAQLLRELKKAGFNEGQIQNVVDKLRQIGFGDFFGPGGACAP